MSRRPDKYNLLFHIHTLFIMITLFTLNHSSIRLHKYPKIHLSRPRMDHTHLNYTCAKANITLGFLRKNVHHCTCAIKHIDNTFHLYVQPWSTLRCNTGVLCGGVGPTHITNMLESINIKAARFNTHYTQVPNITSHIKKTNMDIFQTRRLTHTYNNVHNCQLLHRQQ